MKLSKKENMLESWRAYVWVLSFLRDYKGRLAAIILLGLIIALGEMSVPQFIQYLIDHVMPAKNLRMFGLSLCLLVLVLGLMIASSAANNVLVRSVREKASRDLQLSLFKHLRRLGFAYYEQHSVGQTLSLFNQNMTAVQNIYTQYLPQSVQQALLILVPLGTVLYMNWALTLLIIPCYFLYYIIGPKTDRQTAVYFERQTKEREMLNKKIYDSVNSIVEVRAYGAVPWEMGRFTEVYRKYANTRLISLLYRHLRYSFRMMATAVGVILMYILGGRYIQDGTMSVGEFVSFTIYMLMLFRSLGHITFLMLEQSYCIAQAKLLYAFSLEQPLVEESGTLRELPEVKGDVRFCDVHFGYPNREPVMEGFTANIPLGKKTAFVGASGSGKSTLLKLVGRFYDPAAGQILLDGVPLPELPLQQIREAVGIVFQETYLFGSTIRENIRFGRPEATDEEIEAAAKAAFIHDFIMEQPDGYDTNVGERGGRLSGGQKQRIAVARMFLKDPAIILLDEATASLDSVSERAVQQALNALLAGRTTIAVAHRISTIADYEQIIVVDQGRAAERGTYEQLMRAQGLFYQLVKGEESMDAQSALDLAVHQE
ncbi:MAG: hypothetical protein K0R57_955 [Paenibacillaceae bacterium]|nr:hypothetical protein [Paenibacillaceae bacterium]